MYNNDIRDEIISRVDIVDVISEHVKLKRSGSSYTGLCPFHSEKSPSFSVSPDKQFYHCFGCGVGGNVITFVMEYENYTYQEALQELANRAGVKLPENAFERKEDPNKTIKASIYDINKLAAVFYFRVLHSPAGKLGMEYLTKRGLDEETIKHFGLGYAGSNSKALYRFLKEKGYSDEILSKTGLFNYKSREPFDIFWNRVIFPIMDKENRVIAFGGRVMGDAKPKYLNSPETLIFNKRLNLFGINYARKSRKKNLIICEGYMDVIALHRAGFDQAVASLGTALTESQAQMMKRYAQLAYITYDSDEAGVKAAIRAVSILRSAGIATKVINMRPYKDPDEFIKNLGAEEFQKRIDTADNSFLYMIEMKKRNFNLSDPDEATKFAEETARELLVFKEKIERSNYIKAVANRFVIDETELTDMVNRMGNAGIKPESAEAVVSRAAQVRIKPKESGFEKSEKILLTLMSDDVELSRRVFEILSPAEFSNDFVCDVARRMKEQSDEGQIKPAIIMNAYESEDEHREVSDIFTSKLDDGLTLEEKLKTVTETVIRIKLAYIEKRLESENDLIKITELMKEKERVMTISFDKG